MILTVTQFLALFSRAHSSSSAEFGQIVAHVRSQRPRSSVTSQASTASPPTLREPFLKNISTNGLPKYTTTYVLRHGSRKPSLCATADGQPFIRSKKPQPAMLSKMIGRKGKIFKKKITNLVNIDDGPADAALEDQWDRLMTAQMNRETISAKKTVDGKLTETFTWSTQLARLWWELKIDLTWQDWLARGEALHQYLQDQKTLDEKANTRVGEAVETVRLASKVAVANLESTSHAKAVRSLLKPGNVEDPFVGPAWITLVQSQERRLLDEVKKRVK
ncbi:hypothetical protein AAL_04070 [Moelleriella libera RCEF 2490]|uniref:Uncharacterized protein n=1 Tax=Moelleriella libera RCEF 2490 TaxID=1081109 RepID=A0A168CNZ1_9HYPO|nr:hypothetical protein AAL_04070 [Moelleriella libera RCEF 2490]